jgi:hypothetical protein
MKARETALWRNEAWKTIAISVSESRRNYDRQQQIEMLERLVSEDRARLNSPHPKHS